MRRGAAAELSAKAEPPLSDIEQDVLSALLNLGCQRAAAEAAVRKAKASRSLRPRSSQCSAKRWSWCDKMRERESLRPRRWKASARLKPLFVPRDWPISPASRISKRTSPSRSRPPRSAAKRMDHVLLYGPPGLGKTTLATIIAGELGVDFEQTSGPILQKKLDLTGVLTNIRARQVFFIDEIHRLLPDVEEILYAALEDFRMDILIGTGPGARTHSISIPHFTAIGATTRQGLVSAPLRGRFGLVLRLNLYAAVELTAIVQRSAKLLGVTVDLEGAQEIARRSRGTPRIANRLLRRVRDYAQVRADGTHRSAPPPLELWTCWKWIATGWTKSIRRSCSRCSKNTAEGRWA